MNKLKYRPVWKWPGQVEDFIAARAEGFIVHVMNGDSQLGDLRIDRYSKNTDICADALWLPIKSEVADTIVCDPPWGLDYTLKPKLMSEMRRVLKFGGRLIFNAPWCPKCPGLAIEEIWCPTYQLMTFNHISLIFVCRKIKSHLFETPCNNNNPVVVNYETSNHTLSALTPSCFALKTGPSN